jgi:hypothetical protein
VHLNKKCIPTLFLVVLFISTSCSTKEQEYQPSKWILDKHIEFSQYTDPGELGYLYDDLPESIEELCNLIKKQLVHPFDINKFGDKIPGDRVYEDRAIPSVSQMLAELLTRDKNGLLPTRQPEDRLVVACVHHSLLLASILRYRGIPIRIRAGYAKYIGDDNNVRVSHVVCEVWDNERNVWFLVDPDRNKVDFKRQEFEFAFESWRLLRNHKIDKKYYISRYKSVDQATAHLLCHDLSYVIGKEEPYWNDPPIVNKIVEGISDLSKIELQLLDNVAERLSKPDMYLDELVSIQRNNNSLMYNKL